MAKERIMIIGAGPLQEPAVLVANEMGLETIVTDYNANAPGMKHARHPVVMSTRDVEGTVRIAKELAAKTPIHGVITIGTDASMTVAAVANALNLPGIKFTDAYAATNKIRMRERFQQHNVPQPAFFPAWTWQEAITAFRKLKGPVVVKPADNMGARGVMKIFTEDEMHFGFQRAKSASPSGEVIVEECLVGPELSIDMLVHNGEIHVTGVADRIIKYPPYFVETGHILPSALPDAQIEDAVRVMKEGVRALNISIGAAKGDIKVTPEGAKVGEIAARLSGGFMSAFTYPLATGVNLVKNAIEVALGRAPSDLTPKWNKVAMEKAIIPGAGIVQAVSGVDAVRKMDGVKEVFIRTHVGDILVPPTNNLEKAGNVIVVADTRDEAITLANTAVNGISITLAKHGETTVRDGQGDVRDQADHTPLSSMPPEEKREWYDDLVSAHQDEAFKRNVESLREYKIVTSLIHNVRDPHTEKEVFSYALDVPLIAAPVVGGAAYMKSGMSEEEYAQNIANGCKEAGILAAFGDMGDTESYKIGLKAIERAKAGGILFFKPIRNQRDIIDRIHRAEDVGATAVGIDIDAASYLALSNRNEIVVKNEDEIQELVDATELPFIVKGIMSAHDAKIAIGAGVKGIYVSNQGGRVIDSSPGVADVLPEIGEIVGHKATIFADGGFRSGSDILKGIALRASVVGIGRPIAITVARSGARGVQYLVTKIKEELKQAMIVTGRKNIADIRPETVRKYTHG